ncbi:MAG: DUF4239 domain-containing protein [Actinomycetales bacterium]|nr:DUF4239 domain-containing protein [Actinomycetales bacterium]
MPHYIVLIVLVVVVAFAITVPITVWTLTKERTDRSNDNVSTAGIRFIGGVFVLISSFSIVTLWGAQTQASERMTRELTTLALFTDNVVLTSPADQQTAYDLLRQYAAGVRDDELSVLAGGQRLDPSVALSDRATRALDGFDELLDQIQAQGVELGSLRSELEKLEVAYLDRVSWQPPVSLALIIPWIVISVGTLLSIAVYPAGSSARDKWLQSLISTALVACLLAMLVVLISPQYQAANQTSVVNAFLSKVDARLSE